MTTLGVLSSDEYWNFVSEGKNIEQAGHFHELANDVNAGRYSWQEFMASVANDSGKTLDQVKRLYDEHTLNVKALSLAKSLKPKYTLGVLSNAHHDYIQPILEEAKLSEVFDYVFVSSRIGFIKPQPQIYEHALAALGCQPEQCLFIDDAVSNVEGANKVGIDTILYRSYSQLVEDLRQKGVEIA